MSGNVPGIFGSLERINFLVQVGSKGIFEIRNHAIEKQVAAKNDIRINQFDADVAIRMTFPGSEFDFRAAQIQNRFFVVRERFDFWIFNSLFFLEFVVLEFDILQNVLVSWFGDPKVGRFGVREKTVCAAGMISMKMGHDDIGRPTAGQFFGPFSNPASAFGCI